MILKLLQELSLYFYIAITLLVVIGLPIYAVYRLYIWLTSELDKYNNEENNEDDIEDCNKEYTDVEETIGDLR